MRGNIVSQETFSYGGVFPEELIPEYSTISVTGREALPENATKREIKVKYRLKSNTHNGFRKAYNALNRFFEKEEQQLIFQDEPDKYFIGTLTACAEVKEGVNDVVSTLTFTCKDPCKYAVEKKEFTASVNSDGVLELLIQNDGLPCHIDYEIENHQENGFIGIVSKEGVMQFGKIDEPDGEKYSKAETVLQIPNAQSLAALTLNEGYLPETISQNGTVKVVNDSDHYWLALDNVGSGSSWHGATVISEIPNSTQNTPVINFNMESGIWFQPENAGQTGRMDFCFTDANHQVVCWLNLYKYAKSNMTIHTDFGTKSGQIRQSSFEVATPRVMDSSVQKVFSNTCAGSYQVWAEIQQTAVDTVSWTVKYKCGGYKYINVSAKDTFVLKIGDTTVFNHQQVCQFQNYNSTLTIGSGTANVSGSNIPVSISFTPGATGRYFPTSLSGNGTVNLTTPGQLADPKAITFCKYGGRIDCTINGKKQSVFDEAIKDTAVKYLTIGLSQYGDFANLSNRLYVRYIKMRDDFVPHYRDIPNRYAADSVIKIDGTAGKIYVNDIERPDDEVIGTQYFQVPTGLSRIEVYYSDWVSTQPTVTARIRERWR